ncbi:hypothetical protein MNV84_03247 [Leishmania braziliensis]|nr:hypothetical protein MNV84_03247 [Leishmania braziliensis]
MALPSVLHLGSHELRLLPVSCSAEVLPGTHRCSDSLLTAFCFVGELQADAVDLSGQVREAASDTNGSCATILWYYSPLFQFEQKRIRVEEGVIDAALTKEVKARQHADVKSPSLQLDGAEAVEYQVSCPMRSSETSSAALSVASTTALPALYLRIGISTTFREYRLVIAGPQSAALGTSIELRAQSDADVVGNDDGALSGHAVHKPPALQPLIPRHPTLTPLDARLSSSGVRGMVRLAHKHSAALRRGVVPTSASIRRDAARLEDEVKTPQLPNSFKATPSTAIVAASPLHARSEGASEPHEVVFSIPISLSREDGESSPYPRKEGNLSQWALSVGHDGTSEMCARKDVSHGSLTFNTAGGSSVSSAFLSSTLFFSCIPSSTPTSVPSIARSAEADTDDLHSSSTEASGSSGRFFDDTDLDSREITHISSEACTLRPQCTSSPTPPATPKPCCTRGRRLRILGSNSSGLPRSTHAPHSPAVQGIQLVLESVSVASPLSSW